MVVVLQRNPTQVYTQLQDEKEEKLYKKSLVDIKKGKPSKVSYPTADDLGFTIAPPPNREEMETTLGNLLGEWCKPISGTVYDAVKAVRKAKPEIASYWKRLPEEKVVEYTAPRTNAEDEKIGKEGDVSETEARFLEGKGKLLGPVFGVLEKHGWNPRGNTLENYNISANTMKDIHDDLVKCLPAMDFDFEQTIHTNLLAKVKDSKGKENWEISEMCQKIGFSDSSHLKKAWAQIQLGFKYLEALTAAKNTALADKRGEKKSNKEIKVECDKILKEHDTQIREFVAIWKEQVADTNVAAADAVKRANPHDLRHPVKAHDRHGIPNNPKPGGVSLTRSDQDMATAFTNFFHHFVALPDKKDTEVFAKYKNECTSSLSKHVARCEELLKSVFHVEIEAEFKIWSRDYTREHERQRLLSVADWIERNELPSGDQLLEQLKTAPYWTMLSKLSKSVISSADTSLKTFQVSGVDDDFLTKSYEKLINKETHKKTAEHIPDLALETTAKPWEDGNKLTTFVAGGQMKYCNDPNGSILCTMCQNNVYVGYQRGTASVCNICYHTARPGKMDSPWGCTVPCALAVAQRWKEYHGGQLKPLSAYLESVQNATSGGIGWLLKDEWRHTGRACTSRRMGEYTLADAYPIGPQLHDTVISGESANRELSASVNPGDLSQVVGKGERGTGTETSSGDNSQEEGLETQVPHLTPLAELKKRKGCIELEGPIEFLKKCKREDDLVHTSQADVAKVKAKLRKDIKESSGDGLKQPVLQMMTVMEIEASQREFIKLSMSTKEAGDDNDDETEDGDDVAASQTGAAERFYFPDTMSESAAVDYVNKFWLFGVKATAGTQHAVMPQLIPFKARKWIWVKGYKRRLWYAERAELFHPMFKRVMKEGNAMDAFGKGANVAALFTAVLKQLFGLFATTRPGGYTCNVCNTKVLPTSIVTVEQQADLTWKSLGQKKIVKPGVLEQAKLAADNIKLIAKGAPPKFMKKQYKVERVCQGYFCHHRELNIKSIQSLQRTYAVCMSCAEDPSTAIDNQDSDWNMYDSKTAEDNEAFASKFKEDAEGNQVVPAGADGANLDLVATKRLQLVDPVAAQANTRELTKAELMIARSQAFKKIGPYEEFFIAHGYANEPTDVEKVTAGLPVEVADQGKKGVPAAVVADAQEEFGFGNEGLSKEEILVNNAKWQEWQKVLDYRFRQTKACKTNKLKVAMAYEAGATDMLKEWVNAGDASTLEAAGLSAGTVGAKKDAFFCALFAVKESSLLSGKVIKGELKEKRAKTAMRTFATMLGSFTFAGNINAWFNSASDANSEAAKIEEEENKKEKENQNSAQQEKVREWQRKGDPLAHASQYVLCRVSP